MRTVTALVFLVCCYLAVVHIEDPGYLILPILSGILLVGTIISKDYRL